LDRRQECPQLGAVDTEAGEFWVNSPFEMPRLGHNLSAYERKRLFINVGGRQFIDASFSSTTDIDSDGRSVVAADFNADGAIDLLVGSVGGGPLRLFLNRIENGLSAEVAGSDASPSHHNNHRVRIDLQGQKSNRPGIGARVIARCGSQQITRDVFPPNGCLGQGPVELILGVGEATTIDELTVRWPSGITQQFKSVPVDKRLQITEGKEDYGVLSF
jgi:hypothetical protein